MNWCISTHTHTHTHARTHARARARARGGGGVRTGSHVHAHKQTNLSISLPSSLSLSLSLSRYLSLPLSILLFLCRARTLSCARILRHMHEWKLALFRFSELTVFWLCFFSPLTDSTTISLCKRVALLTGNVYFFTMPYLALIILIIIGCRCQYSSFFSFSFLMLLKVFVNGGNDSRTHCSHNFFTITACAMVTKSTEGKIDNTTVACVPFFAMGQKNNT